MDLQDVAPTVSRRVCAKTENATKTRFLVVDSKRTDSNLDARSGRFQGHSRVRDLN